VRPQKNVSAFSLVELLCTLAIIIVLAMMIGGRGSSSRQKRDLMNCAKNLQTIHTALTIYGAENKNAFPVVTHARSSEAPLSLLVPKCTTETSVFICPGSSDSELPQGETFEKRKISYAFYMGWRADTTGAPLLSDRQVNTGPKKSDELIFSADGKGAGANHHKYGGNVLFSGGEVKRSAPRAKFELLFPTNVILLNPKS
jgi:type II secretory pathway pseudopilin PulG